MSASSTPHPPDSAIAEFRVIGDALFARAPEVRAALAAAVPEGHTGFDPAAGIAWAAAPPASVDLFMLDLAIRDLGFTTDLVTRPDPRPISREELNALVERTSAPQKLLTLTATVSVNPPAAQGPVSPAAPAYERQHSEKPQFLSAAENPSVAVVEPPRPAPPGGRDDHPASIDPPSLISMLAAESEIWFRVSGVLSARGGEILERELETEEGVLTARLMFATRRLTIRGRADLDPQRLGGRIRELGYRARLIWSGPAGEAAEARERERGLRDGSIERWRQRAFGSMATAAILSLTYPVPSIETRLAEIHGLLATGILIVAGTPFYSAGWRSLRARRLDPDLRHALALTMLWLIGFQRYWIEGPSSRAFLMMVLALTFACLGRWVREWTRKSIEDQTADLDRMIPKTAKRVKADGAAEETSVTALRPGDHIRVGTGEIIPVDGRIERRSAEVMEGALTGGRRASLRPPGARVYAGSRNEGAPARVVVDRVGAKTALRGILSRIDAARGRLSPLQLAADRGAKWSMIVGLAAAPVALVWTLVMGLGFEEAARRTAAALLVVSPASVAFSLIAPWLAALGAGVRRGVVFTSAEDLENLARCEAVALRLHPLMTMGAPELTTIQPHGEHDRNELLIVAASLLAQSNEPAARAIVAAARSEGLPFKALRPLRVTPGRGVRCEDPPLAMGTADYLREQNALFEPMPNKLLRAESRGESTLLVGEPGVGLIGGFALADHLRPGAFRAARDLREMGLMALLLTEASPVTARALARLLGMGEFRSRIGVGETTAIARELRKTKANWTLVAGMEDLEALSEAPTAVAAVTPEAVGVVPAAAYLVGPRPAQAPTGFALAVSARRRGRENLVGMIALQGLGFALATFGWLDPALAALWSALLSAAPFWNALRVLRPPDPLG